MKHSVQGGGTAGCRRVILSGKKNIVLPCEMNSSRNTQRNQQNKRDGKDPSHDPEPLFQNADLLFLRNNLAPCGALQLRIGTAGNSDGCTGSYGMSAHILKTFGAENLPSLDIPSASHAFHAAHPPFLCISHCTTIYSFRKGLFPQQTYKKYKKRSLYLYSLKNCKFTKYLQTVCRLLLTVM